MRKLAVTAPRAASSGNTFKKLTSTGSIAAMLGGGIVAISTGGLVAAAAGAALPVAGEFVLAAIGVAGGAAISQRA